VSLFFRAAYLFGMKPWDSGVSPPELVSVVEGPNHLAPGRALDLGCGTGTNVIYLARHGWDATGVDFVPRAVDMAIHKAASAGVSPRLVVGDVKRLTELGLTTPYDLLLDIGCFHSVPDAGREGYVRGATTVAGPGATMLLFAMERPENPTRFGPRGVAPGEIRQRFGADWEIIAADKGRPMFGSDVYWYRLARR
jgi:cyclopropane fatty-acyl-phospholipid synthase-like methyltransferase